MVPKTMTFLTTALGEDPFGEVISRASFDVCFETRPFLACCSAMSFFVRSNTTCMAKIINLRVLPVWLSVNLYCPNDGLNNWLVNKSRHLI